MLNEQTYNYIIDFLVGEKLPQNTIGYTNDSELFGKYKIVIRPSDFFSDNIYGTEKSIPTLPVETIGITPILFGSAENYCAENTLVTNADFIASTYFLITRYEETVNSARDVHGRFPFSESTLHKLNYLHKPIVDEYGKILRTYLRKCGIDIPEPQQGFSKIYLTHDVDKISQYRNVRGFGGGILRSIKRMDFKALIRVFRSACCGVKYDPLYTFEWLFEQNSKISEAETIVFVKSSHSKIEEDQPCYNIFSKEAQYLIAHCKQDKATIGLHASYQSGKETEVIAHDKQALEQALGGETIRINRHHYLRSCEPADMQALIDAGITDDFTMGFADYAGFRLGTCSAVQWINPHTQELTNLTLHPLTIMEFSLVAPKYMNLSYEKALEYSTLLVEEVYKNGGELVLLWHNPAVSTLPEYATYQAKLYDDLIKLIAHKQSKLYA